MSISCGPVVNLSLGYYMNNQSYSAGDEAKILCYSGKEFENWEYRMMFKQEQGLEQKKSQVYKLILNYPLGQRSRNALMIPVS